jgi:DNA repair exonuclease SbcCD ATPase subunit
MNFRATSRRLVLSIPRVRRFYEYAADLRAKVESLEAELAQRNAEIRSLLRRAEFERRSAANESREDLELRLYTLQSDYQYVVALLDQNRSALSEARAGLETLRRESKEMATRFNDADPPSASCANQRSGTPKS